MSKPGLVQLLLAELERDPSALAELRALVAGGGKGDESSLLDPMEAAARIGLHPKTLTRAARDGRMPGAGKVAGRWRFHPDNLEILPVEPADSAPAGLGRPSRKVRAADPVARAMRDTARRRAAA